ncbi:MAG: hypothetical protein QM632_06915 [Micrococcaceae bacterium]
MLKQNSVGIIAILVGFIGIYLTVPRLLSMQALFFYILSLIAIVIGSILISEGFKNTQADRERLWKKVTPAKD